MNCTNCQTEISPRTKSGLCKKCWQKKYQKEHKEEHRQRQLKYLKTQEGKQKLDEYHNSEKYKKKRKKASRQYYLKHREQILDRYKEYYHLNKWFSTKNMAIGESV